MIRRRAFVGGLAALLAAPGSARAQSASRPAKIGVLDALSPGSVRQHLWDGFRQRLRELGYREGEQVTLEYRWAHNQQERLPGLAAELVRLNVDVIVAASTVAAFAAKRATATIPIVMTNTGDPVATGLVASLAQPGGNVTGLTTLSAELTVKRLELLREIAPTISRVAVLWDDTNPSFTAAVRDTQAAAESVGIQVLVMTARTADDVERAFTAMGAQQVSAFIAMPAPVFLPARRRMAELALKQRLLSVYAQREYVDAGGLVAYGSSLSDLFARAGDFVVKILNGAKPANLPVEQPTKFELVFNMKTAKALGLTVPPSLRLRADSLIE